MIGLLQRVSYAKVEVNSEVVGQIEHGLLVLLGIERGDHESSADRLLQRLLSYRVFEDDEKKMNLSLQQVNGGLLLVPQFTLPADTRKGTRPSLTPAAAADQGARLYHYFVQQAQQQHPDVAAGEFAADMQVSLTNNGPVTFWLQAK
ncbi:MAG: D-aminoacyl-tRNA deacylase [Gammaproteobacteria bacterium]|nr:D-aminoacyl-tRNA deacylase [Gammaproteobacteria bacterium]MCF6230361.1 D-aminoacyl-tRNA deacylase [Gammaproteobacteria bacterium]